MKIEYTLKPSDYKVKNEYLGPMIRLGLNIQEKRESTSRLANSLAKDRFVKLLSQSEFKDCLRPNKLENFDKSMRRDFYDQIMVSDIEKVFEFFRAE